MNWGIIFIQHVRQNTENVRMLQKTGRKNLGVIIFARGTNG